MQLTNKFTKRKLNVVIKTGNIAIYLRMRLCDLTFDNAVHTKAINFAI